MRLLHGPFISRTTERFQGSDVTLLELPSGTEVELSTIGGPDCPCGLCEDRKEVVGKPGGWMWSRQAPERPGNAVRADDPIYMVHPAGANLDGRTP